MSDHLDSVRIADIPGRARGANLRESALVRVRSKPTMLLRSIVRLGVVTCCACAPHGREADRGTLPSAGPRDDVVEPTPVPTSPPVPEREPPPPPRPSEPTMRCFADASRFDTESNVSWGTMGDLDGDGRSDVVATAGLREQIVVMLADDAGGFRRHVEIAGNPETFRALVGDFDGDGRADVVTGNPRDGTVSFIAGDGEGGLGARTDSKLGFSYYELLADDRDRDGDLDLLATRLRHVEELVGDGNGRFERGRSWSVGQGPERIHLADIDADGRADLVLPNNDSYDLAILLGRKGGGFGKRASIPCGEAPVALAIADFDRDGTKDVAMHASRSADICLMRGRGRGRFEVRERLATYDSWVLEASDLDDDGAVDLLIVDGGDLLTLRNDGRGAFTRHARDEAGGDMHELWLRDVDADGLEDAILLDTGGPTFRIDEHGRYPTAQVVVLRGTACTVR